MTQYDLFKSKLDEIIKPVLDKNIIIYGCSTGGGDIKWFLEYFYAKSPKAIIDRWAFSPIGTIPHLWAFYYIYDKNDIIINTTPFNIIEEFNNTGEDWREVLYTDDQIINAWDVFYGKERCNLDANQKYPAISFYDWMEKEYQLDIVDTIQRKYVQSGHGYFPTDFRMIYEGIKQYDINIEEDSILDIGSGKGSGIFSFIACGFRKIGAVEYTDSIYKVLKNNLIKMDMSIKECAVDCVEQNEVSGEMVTCYQGDAALMTRTLDVYNWFFMFNPFSMDVLKRVIDNICESIRRKPRKCFIFYAEPIGHSYILNTGFFECDKCITSDYSGVSYYGYIYCSKEEQR